MTDKHAPTTSSNTAACLCGRRCWSRPAEAVTLALFTLTGPLKDTGWTQCWQLYLSLHGDGVLLTGNFPGSLPDEVVGSTSLPRSICFHSTHGPAEIQERDERGGRARAKRKYCLHETASHRRTGGKGQQMREKREIRMQQEEKRGRERLTNKKDEEAEGLKAMFLKCRSSAELQSGQRTANGLFGEKGEDGRRDELLNWGVTFSRSCNYLIQTLDSQLAPKGLKTCPLINHDRKPNVLLYFWAS